MVHEINKQTGTFRSFDGTEIYYEVRGHGKPIVFVYGIACLMNHWHHQINFFSKKYQTIAFDFRGHHRSGTPDDPSELSIDAMAKDIKCLLDHLKIKQASFMGHSYGGPVILKAYELYPQIFTNMILVNTFVSDPIKGMFGTDVLPQIFGYIKGAHLQYPDIISLIWKKSVMNPLSIPLTALAGGFNLRLTKLKDIEVYARGVASLDMNVFLSLFENMMGFDGHHILELINVPTLIISGENDGVTPMSHQIKMHAGIKNSEFQKVPYGSHCTQLDLPEFVNLRIAQFYNDHDYSPEIPKLMSKTHASTKGKRASSKQSLPTQE